MSKQQLPVIFGHENLYPSEVSSGMLCYAHGYIPDEELQYMYIRVADTNGETPALIAVCKDCIYEECEIATPMEL